MGLMEPAKHPWFEFLHDKIPDDIVVNTDNVATLVETERIFVRFVQNPKIDFLFGMP